MKSPKCLKKVCVITMIFIILIIYFMNEFSIVIERDFSSIDVVGIIDDALRKVPGENVKYDGDILRDEFSHGENLLNYLEDIGYDEEVYYYSAERDGTISSNSIIDGLEWMKTNGVKCINISLSSKKRDEKLENWILDNPEMKIFCSYNNQLNTFDYPAMMDGTIASGTNNISYKECDVQYKTNRIVVINKGIRYYQGNSYLSIETMLNYGWDSNE